MRNTQNRFRLVNYLVVHRHEVGLLPAKHAARGFYIYILVKRATQTMRRDEVTIKKKIKN